MQQDAHVEGFILFYHKYETNVINAFNETCKKMKADTHISMAQAHFGSYIKFFRESHLYCQVC